MGTDILVLSFNAESVLLSRVQHSTQAASYTHARQNRLLFAKRQRGGAFRLHAGCANTQWTSGISSHVPQGPG